MITHQRGFFFAIFATSFMISAMLIFNFVGFVFKIGFSKPDPFNQASSYHIINNIQGPYIPYHWETPGWSGRFALGTIHNLLADETK